jgi:hypothetical protein
MQRTELARGCITQFGELLVELQEPDHNSRAVLIRWPEHPTVVDPRRFAATSRQCRPHPRHGGRETRTDQSATDLELS